jgi:hypothetical protein
MKFRYAVFFIALCFVLYWSFSRIMNSGELNNNSNQLETKIDSMNTIDEIPVHVTEQDNESNILDKKINTNAKEDVKTMEPNKIKEDIIDEPDYMELDKKHSIDLAETVGRSVSKDKLWRAIERKANYNNELQSYNKDNVSFTDNKIIITSKKEDRDEKNYTSGLVESNYAYLNGYFEFTIKMSYGKGIFPAIWLMPANHSSYPEVDIFEMIGSDPTKFYGVIHYLNSDNIKSRNYFTQKVELKDSYKVALQWNTDELIWYIDDNIVYRTVNGIPNQYMYIIINQAVGGNWPGEPSVDTMFPSEFTIQDIVINPIEKQSR